MHEFFISGKHIVKLNSHIPILRVSQDHLNHPNVKSA